MQLPKGDRYVRICYEEIIIVVALSSGWRRCRNGRWRHRDRGGCVRSTLARSLTERDTVGQDNLNVSPIVVRRVHSAALCGVVEAQEIGRLCGCGLLQRLLKYIVRGRSPRVIEHLQSSSPKK